MKNYRVCVVVNVWMDIEAESKSIATQAARDEWVDFIDDAEIDNVTVELEE